MSLCLCVESLRLDLCCNHKCIFYLSVTNFDPLRLAFSIIFWSLDWWNLILYHLVSEPKTLILGCVHQTFILFNYVLIFVSFPNRKTYKNCICFALFCLFEIHKIIKKIHCFTFRCLYIKFLKTHKNICYYLFLFLF